MKRSISVILAVFALLVQSTPSGSAAGLSCISFGIPSASSSTSSINVRVPVSASCKGSFGMSNGGAVYTITGESSLSSSCSGPYDYSMPFNGTISCSINVGGSLGSSRIGATTSTIHIWFAYDSSTKDISFSHQAIIGKPATGGGGASGQGTSTSGNSSGITKSCTAQADMPALTHSWNAQGAVFTITPSYSQPVYSLSYNWSLYNQANSSWEGWSAWENKVTQTQFSIIIPEDNIHSRVAFAVFATNACGSSKASRENDASNGIVLGSLKQDEISKSASVSEKFYAGDLILLSNLLISKYNLYLTTTSISPATCSIKANYLYFENNGECEISSTSVTSDNKVGANRSSYKFTVLPRKLTQYIPDFDLKKSYSPSLKSIALEKLSSVGLLIEFSTYDSDVCEFDGSRILLRSPGTCTIIASQSGNDQYESATDVFASFEITSPVITITCQKGKTLRKISALKPKCPAGYKIAK